MSFQSLKTLPIQLPNGLAKFGTASSIYVIRPQADTLTLIGPGGFNEFTGAFVGTNSPVVTSAGLWVGTDQNKVLQSQTIATGTAATAPWAIDSGGGAPGDPVLDDDAAVAPDGTSTADQVDFPAIAGSGQFSRLQQSFTGTAVAWTISFWGRTVTGVGTLYINVFNGTTHQNAPFSLTTTWQRFSITSTLAAGTCSFEFGPVGDAGGRAEPTTQPALSVYLWGAQVQPGTIASPYHTTVATAFASTYDTCTTPVRCSNAGKFAVGITCTPAMGWTHANYHTLFSFGINDTANSLTAYQFGASLNIYSYNGSTQYVNNYGAHGLTGSAEAKMAVEIIGPIVRYSVNGGAIQTFTMTGTGAGMAAFPATFRIGGTGSPTLQLGGYVKKIVQCNSIQEANLELAKP
jgi:hypothetical protein